LRNSIKISSYIFIATRYSWENMKSQSPYHCQYCPMIRMQEGSVGIETQNIIFEFIILAI